MNLKITDRLNLCDFLWYKNNKREHPHLVMSLWIEQSINNNKITQTHDGPKQITRTTTIFDRYFVWQQLSLLLQYYRPKQKTKAVFLFFVRVWYLFRLLKIDK
jgi:hypothetical protein